MFVKYVVASAALASASMSSAQWVPGGEIVGQEVHVQTNGITNVVRFQRNGVATIGSPSGAKVVDATWSADSGKICLETASTNDCYPYTRPFTAQQAVDLMSDCGVRSRWTALSTTESPILSGERG